MPASVAPYGSWRSPISAASVAGRGIGVAELRLDGDALYWLELRPAEGGRQVLVRRATDGTIADVTPSKFNLRTRVHEYGGGAYAVDAGTAYFANFADQRLYRQRLGEEPQPLTVDAAGKLRLADITVDRAHRRLLAVQEDHRGGGEARNQLVAIDPERAALEVLVSGADFYSSPRPSPDGRLLAWLTWNHPDMPWDATELWLAEVGPDGLLRDARRIAGGPGESVTEPRWSLDGVLHFVSDRTGWWNLYGYRAGRSEALVPREAEFASSHWVFGQSSYAFLRDGRIVCHYVERGMGHLGLLADGALDRLELGYSWYGSIQAAGERVYCWAASATTPAAIVEIDVGRVSSRVIRRTREVDVPPDYLTEPEAIEFPTSGDGTAHGLYYPPRNRDYVAPAGARPPLIVLSHGGPTAMSPPLFNLAIQFWTSRGFGVLDVNYGGSTGYGRPYRERLYGRWGIVDVDDCVEGARYLVRRGDVDGERLLIRGGSAGGYTTLCALTFRDAFRAGASYYGVSDLAALTRDTHKFESRYLDRLVGPYPERRDRYEARSPIHHVERLSRPVIFFQGLDDPVVPPDQSERMVEALRRKRIPVAYVPFAGEQHGFRKAENIARALEAELFFYARVLDVPLADEIEPVPIDNLAPATA